MAFGSLRGLLLGILTLPLGCLGGESPAEIILAGVPARIEATYQFGADTQELGSFEVSGFESYPALLGDGTQGMFPRLRVKFTATAETEFHAYAVYIFHGVGGVVASIEVVCVPAEGAVSPCDANDPRGRTNWIPDAAGLPGLFGLGPLAGRTLRSGDGWQLVVPDPRGDFRISYSFGSLSRINGLSCLDIVWTQESSTTPTEKTPVPLAPIDGTAVVCEGSPLPILFRFGPFWARILTADTSGELDSPPVATPRSNSLMPCSYSLPEAAQDLMTTEEWVSWGRSNDEFLRSWLTSHPSSILEAGFGRMYRDLALAGAGTVSAVLVLRDTESNDVVPRDVSVAREWVAGQTIRSNYEQSRSYGGLPPNRIAGGATSECEGTVDLSSFDRRALELVGLPARSVKIFTSPEVVSSWQGSLDGFAPFWMHDARILGIGGPPRGATRVYAVVSLDNDRTVASPVEIAFDAATGWVRRAEVGFRDPESISP